MTEQYLIVPAGKEDGNYVDGYVYTTYAKAELAAKKYASKKQEDYVILKDYATAKAVVPQIEVVKH